MTYISSTFWRADGVRRKKVRLDLMLGLSVKHLMSTTRAMASQPWRSTSEVKIISRVMPWRGSFGDAFFAASLDVGASPGLVASVAVSGAVAARFSGACPGAFSFGVVMAPF